MEIFVRAYQDSDGDGLGDLRGLISRLDYLKDLGIRGLWLMPVTRSADGDHGYATTDFRDIEPAYGTLADFDELLKQAHARGIGVITDYVINHSSHRHPAFQAALKGSGPDNPWPAFAIRATWQVAGTVEHWGHVHERENQFEAVFSIKPVNNNWKITRMDILGQQQKSARTTLRRFRYADHTPPVTLKHPRQTAWLADRSRQ
jgi:glycosidase